MGGYLRPAQFKSATPSTSTAQHCALEKRPGLQRRALPEFMPLGDGAAKTPATKRVAIVKKFILNEVYYLVRKVEIEASVSIVNLLSCLVMLRRLEQREMNKIFIFAF